MKKMILKFWSAWCKKVEEHNEPLRTYETQEECWQPSFLFYPLIYGVIGAALWALFAVSAGKFNALIYTPLAGLGMLVAAILMMACNWIFYSKRREV